MQKMKVGIIGCGNICGIYFKNLKRFEHIEVAACADIVPERAAEKAAEFQVPKACSPAELLADDSIELVVNLTIPKAHVPVALAALKAGKHVYGEKPLGVTRAEGQKLMTAAKKARLRIGSAPDTFLGGAFQTCRKLIDDGAIGKPIGATAFMICHGHESWHPAPEFYYKKGGGPMLDMGPYYITSLVNLLGPARRVCGSCRITFPYRTITSQPKNGTKVKVEVPTHYAGSIDFVSGAVATVIMSFDVWAGNLPRIEIYGTEGSLSVPDPNGFGGEVKIFKPGSDGWKPVTLTHSYTENWRGVGVADMAAGIRNKREHRASGALAMHVLDIMQAFAESTKAGRHIAITNKCKRPEAFPVGLVDGKVEV